ncbi:hypothetical protein [Rugamonas aquatica]|uniref:Uncharacterized protein n=1 Tax=Rugamonas aquatica TaxID=2743357 RepID=A0A6A7N6M4_9BURK|nr:hypothetical protein [Rugamonas aquatica]MQA40558.1 hypothetical protein [Rugamonas aquatica]
MRASKRSGTHMCLDSQERLLYKLTFSPAGDDHSNLLPLGFAWPINIYVFDGGHHLDLERDRDAYRRRIDGLRADAPVGARVGVARSKLSAKFPDGGWPGGQYTCAPIIGRQGPLVQVQIRTFQLYVELDAIYPLAQADGNVLPQSRKSSRPDCAP